MTTDTDPPSPSVAAADPGPAGERAPSGDGGFAAVLAGLRGAAEPTRLRVLMLCGLSELTVSDLTQILGQSQPRVSRHLKLLTDAGLLERYREGTFALFRLAAGGPGVRAVRAVLDQLPGDEALLRRDRERLEAIKRERAERAARYFEANARQWDHLRSLHIADSEVEGVLVELMGREPAAALLDIGTGTGRMLQVLSPLAGRSVGIDLSRQMLAVARARLERAQLADCQVRHADLYHPPFPDGSFDVAVMHQVLHFLEDPLDALKQAARVLRPGGRLLIADLAPHDLVDLRNDHAHRWLGLPLDALMRWLDDAGLVAEEHRLLAGHPLTVQVVAARKPPAVGP